MNLFGRSNFIEIYDNTLSKKECEILINQFEKSNHKEGVILTGDGYAIKPDVKKCRQFGWKLSDTSVVSNIIKSHLSGCIEKYNKKYPEMLDNLDSWNFEDRYSFQKYDGKDDGFKRWHCDSGGKSSCSRVLVWMFYLNNAQSGTDYMYYPNINAKRGRCIIWPASITHVHRSHLPNKGLKYIVTGWVSFDK